MRATAALSSVWVSSIPIARGQEERLRVDADRVEYWQGQGAQIVRARVAKPGKGSQPRPPDCRWAA